MGKNIFNKLIFFCIIFCYFPLPFWAPSDDGNCCLALIPDSTPPLPLRVSLPATPLCHLDVRNLFQLRPSRNFVINNAARRRPLRNNISIIISWQGQKKETWSFHGTVQRFNAEFRAGFKGSVAVATTAVSTPKARKNYAKEWEYFLLA